MNKRPKRLAYIDRRHGRPLNPIYWVEHGTPPKDGERRTRRVPVLYLPKIDLSKYPPEKLREIRRKQARSKG